MRNQNEISANKMKKMLLSLISLRFPIASRFLNLNQTALSSNESLSNLRLIKITLLLFNFTFHSCRGFMHLAGSSVARKTDDGVSNQFPIGLRVLVVDDDPTCLKILERMLRTCWYEVTKCSKVEHALNELRMNKNNIDIVISDVHMPGMDGFKLLEQIGLEMDIPVIMMSADDSKKVVMKGVRHGACDYLIKPIRIEALKNIWQHVVRKKNIDCQELEIYGSSDEDDWGWKQCSMKYPSLACEPSWKSLKRKGDSEQVTDKNDFISNFKKPRIVWSIELHQQFVAAVNQLGIENAAPKKIWELMNVSGLSRENVASHLQKYRLYLRKLSPQHVLNVINNSVKKSQVPCIGAMSSLEGSNFQALTHMPQSQQKMLTSFQPMPTRFTGNPSTSIQSYNEGDIMNYEAYKPRLPPQLCNLHSIDNNTHVNLIYGMDMQGNFPFGSAHASTSVAIEHKIQEQVGFDEKGIREFDYNKDMFNGIESQHNVSSSITGYKGIRASQLQQQGIHGIPLEHGISREGCNIAQEQNIYHDELVQDDLLSSMLNEQQESIGQVEGDINFDAYNMDNVYVYD